jgi:DNA-nicking Smr family endonuclease
LSHASYIIITMEMAALTYTPFQSLREFLEKNRFPLNPKKTAETKVDTKSDEEIFQDAMSNVREIKEYRKLQAKKPPKVKRISIQKDNSLDLLQQIIDGRKKITLSDTAEYIEWAHPCTRKDVARKLHGGNFSVQDYIDLHGMNLIEAKEALRLFLNDAAKKRLFCVKVIHGRGLRSPRGPVIKEAMVKWLHTSFSKWILAYSTAKDCDGGLGATYIILKSR